MKSSSEAHGVRGGRELVRALRAGTVDGLKFDIVALKRGDPPIGLQPGPVAVQSTFMTSCRLNCHHSLT